MPGRQIHTRSLREIASGKVTLLNIALISKKELDDENRPLIFSRSDISY